MRSTSTIVLLNSTLAGTTVVYSDGIKVNQDIVACVQADVAGSLFAGNYQIQGSNEIGLSNDINGSSIVNWFNVGSPLTISAAGSAGVQVADIGYQWLRVKFTPNSGTGKVTFSISYKGI